MMTQPDAAVVAACTSFFTDGDFVGVAPFERGHIHDTFVSRWRHEGGETRYLHQRMNREVFRDVAGLMRNVELVTGHLAAAGQADGFRPLELIRARDGASWVESAGECWRTFRFIEGTVSCDVCRDTDMAYDAARAFGRFQRRLGGLDTASLTETIPQFFSAPHRLAQLQKAISADVAGRCDHATAQIDFVSDRVGTVPVMEDLVEAGDIPVRVVHGDTKLNNVLFDVETGAAVSVVDLDTCMPGWSLYDFGDLVRFTAATSVEDEPDASRAGTDLALYQALARGYLDATSDMLSPRERALMPFAAQLVTLTIGMRFLADYLNGDVYFKTTREHHNLERARVQLAMVEFMEQNEREMLLT